MAMVVLQLLLHGGELGIKALGNFPETSSHFKVRAVSSGVGGVQNVSQASLEPQLKSVHDRSQVGVYLSLHRVEAVIEFKLLCFDVLL